MVEAPRVLVLRPLVQSESLAEKLAAAGMKPVVVPAIRILPGDPGEIDELLDEGRSYDWTVFASRNGVDAVFDRAAERGMNTKNLFRAIAAVGPSTKRAIEERGAAVDWLPSRYTTSALAEELPGAGAVALVRPDIAGDELEQTLASRGFEVTRVTAYRTEATAGDDLIRALESGVQAIAFTSASIVGAYVSAAGAETYGAEVCSIGPATSAACRSHGIGVDAEATVHTIDGLVDAVAVHLKTTAGRIS